MTTLSDKESIGTSEAVKPGRKVWNRVHARGGPALRVVQSESAAVSSISETEQGAVWRHARTLGSHAMAAVTRVGRRLADSDPYTGQPASIRDVVEYTRKGGWVGGEHGQLLESPGYVYGVTVAIPLTMILHALCWSLQKMGRVLFIAGLIGLLWLAQVDVIGRMKTAWWWLPFWAWIYVGLIAIACSLVFPLDRPKRET